MNKDKLYHHPHVQKALEKYIRRHLPDLASTHGPEFVREIIYDVYPRDLPKILRSTILDDDLVFKALEIATNSKKHRRAIVLSISRYLLKTKSPELLAKMHTTAPWCFIENVNADLSMKLSIAKNYQIENLEDLERIWAPLISHLDISEYQEKFSSFWMGWSHAMHQLCATTDLYRIPLYEITISTFWNALPQEKKAEVAKQIAMNAQPRFSGFGWGFSRTPLAVIEELEPHLNTPVEEFFEFKYLTGELAGRYFFRILGMKTATTAVYTAAMISCIRGIILKRGLMTESEIDLVIKNHHASQELTQ